MILGHAPYQRPYLYYLSGIHSHHRLVQDYSLRKSYYSLSQSDSLSVSLSLIHILFSSNQKRAFKVARAMEAGGAVINGASFFRAFEMPFGGWKQSGIGTEGVMSRCV